MFKFPKSAFLLTLGLATTSLSPALAQSSPAQMLASIERFETARAKFCAAAPFKTALNLAYREDTRGSYLDDNVDAFIKGYESGDINAAGTSTYTVKISREAAIERYRRNMEAISTTYTDEHPLADLGISEQESTDEEIGKIIDADPHSLETTYNITKSDYESMLARRQLRREIQAELSGYSEVDETRFDVECAPEVTLLRQPTQQVCSELRGKSKFLAYIEQDYRSIQDKFYNFERPSSDDPMSVCDALSGGGNHSFTNDINEILAKVAQSPWQKKTMPYGLADAKAGENSGTLDTYGADIQFGNFKLEARLAPFPMATRDLNPQTLSALRNLNSSLGISLEKDGVILLAGFEITTNTVDWLWQGRQTIVMLAGPGGSMTTIHQLTNGQGNAKFVLPVNSPTKQIWDALSQRQTLLVMLPPTSSDPSFAMPFSVNGQPEAVEKFLKYMRTDAKALLQTEQFELFAARSNGN